MKFAFLGYHQEHNWDAMSKSQQDAMIEDCFTYDSKLLKDGHLIGDGAALQPSRTARTLRWHSGTVVVTDGPFAETKEHLGGIGLLEARDMDHGVEVMSRHSGLHYGATFEIRPLDEETFKRQAASLAALSGSAPTASARAVTFACLGYINENGWGSVSQDERDAMLERCIAFDEARVKSGQWLSGIALQSARTARTPRAKAGQIVVTDSPFAEIKEYLGGIVVLALEDLDDAVALLSKQPAVQFGESIEIRPIDEETTGRWQVMQARVESA
jgi:hypothetical protein